MLWRVVCSVGVGGVVGSASVRCCCSCFACVASAVRKLDTSRETNGHGTHIQSQAGRQTDSKLGIPEFTSGLKHTLHMQLSEKETNILVRALFGMAGLLRLKYFIE